MAKQSSEAQSSKADASASAPALGLVPDNRPPANKVITLTGERLYDILVDAQRTGLSEADVAEVKRILKSEDLTIDAVRQVEQKIRELQDARESHCQSYWIKDG